MTGTLIERLWESDEASRLTNHAARVLQDIIDALNIAQECGEAQKIIFHDDKIEGWRWVHPNGDEWSTISQFESGQPIHPLLIFAINKAK